jgi:hypothetical protein
MFNILSSQLSRQKSVKPIKDYKRSTAQSLHKKSVATLGNGDLQNAVKLPKVCVYLYFLLVVSQ